jgi:BetI-type transcriptional repressor, C-terminal
LFVRELTKAIVSHTQRNDLDLNVVMLMICSEAQSNPKVKELLADAQRKYRDALTGVVRKWQKGGNIAAKGTPASIGKAMLSFFLGFIVQSAMIGGIDPDTAAKGIEGLISSQSPPRR